MRSRLLGASTKTRRSGSRRFFVLAILAMLHMGCAQHQPVLYPNSKYQSVGPVQADTEVGECMQLADSFVGNTNPAVETAKSTGIGAAMASAVGAVVGAFRGRAGRGAAIGAAAGGTGGFMRGLFRSRSNDPVFQRYVQRCLSDRGYETIGWR